MEPSAAVQRKAVVRTGKIANKRNFEDIDSRKCFQYIVFTKDFATFLSRILYIHSSTISVAVQKQPSEVFCQRKCS